MRSVFSYLVIRCCISLNIAIALQYSDEKLEYSINDLGMVYKEKMM